MAHTVFRERAAPRRAIINIFALFSVIILGLLTISVVTTKQGPRFAPILEEVDGINFDNVQEATEFLKSKVRASAGDEFL